MPYILSPLNASTIFLLAIIQLYSSTTIAATVTSPETPLQIYEIAVKNDPSLSIAHALFRAKEENKSLSRGGLYPEIDLNTEIARNREDVDTTGVGSSGVTYFDSHRIQLELKQSLYSKDKFSRIDIAEAEFLVAEIEHTMAHHAVIMSVATTYFEVLSAQDNLNFANAEKQAITEQLAIIKQRYKLGKSTKTDLLEVQASYDLSFAEVILAQDDYKDALEGLTQLTGMAHSQIAKLSPAFVPAQLEPAELDHWVETASSNNLQLQAEQFAILTHKHEIEQQKSGHYPTLDLVAKYRNAETGGRFGDSNTDDKSIGLELDIPIYNGGQINSRVRSAHLKVEESRYRLQQTQRKVIRQTQKAFRAITNSLNRVNALKQAVVSTKAALAAITKGYKVGARTTADVLDAQRELYKTKRDYSADRYNYALNYLQLKNISGQLNKDDLVTIEQWFK